MAEDYKSYTIVRGDNLTKIAKAFGTTVDELVKLNNIENPNLIYAGAELKIPLSAEEIEAKAKEEAEAAEKAAAAAKAAAEAKAEAMAKAQAAAKAAAAKKAEEAAKAAEEAKETAEEESEGLGSKIASLFKKKS